MEHNIYQVISVCIVHARRVVQLINNKTLFIASIIIICVNLISVFSQNIINPGFPFKMLDKWRKYRVSEDPRRYQTGTHVHINPEILDIWSMLWEMMRLTLSFSNYYYFFFFTTLYLKECTSTHILRRASSNCATLMSSLRSLEVAHLKSIDHIMYPIFIIAMRNPNRPCFPPAKQINYLWYQANTFVVIAISYNWWFKFVKFFWQKVRYRQLKAMVWTNQPLVFLLPGKVKTAEFSSF